MIYESVILDGAQRNNLPMVALIITTVLVGYIVSSLIIQHLRVERLKEIAKLIEDCHQRKEFAKHADTTRKSL